MQAEKDDSQVRYCWTVQDAETGIHTMYAEPSFQPQQEFTTTARCQHTRYMNHQWILIGLACRRSSFRVGLVCFLLLESPHLHSRIDTPSSKQIYTQCHCQDPGLPGQPSSCWSSWPSQSTHTQSASRAPRPRHSQHPKSNLATRYVSTNT